MGRSINGWTSFAGRGLGQGRARSPGWKAWVVALGLLSGCAQEARYEAKLLTEACSGTPALDGVHYLRFRVTGEGMEPVERYVPVEEGTAGLPAVPAGKGRVLEVRGYTDLPRSGGRVVSLGRSRPFEVPESSSAARPMVQLAVRRVDEYVRPGGANDACVALADPRAGHTATLLEDGRVLLAGGYQIDLNGDSTTLGTAELFEPVTSTLEQAPGLGSPRAFHTATRLPGGKVLLAGGEVITVEGTLPVHDARVVDVARGSSTGVELLTARSRHAAAVDSSGHVLLVGGVGEGGAVLAQADGYDATTGEVFPIRTPVPRLGAGVMAVQGGQRIAVVGGSDGVDLRPEVLFFEFQGGTFEPVGEGARLKEPRRDGALVPYDGTERLLYLGGHDSPVSGEDAHLLASSEVVSPGAAEPVTAGPQIFGRSEPCAVALPDGRVMVLGGRMFGIGGLVSDAHVELLVPGKDGGAPGLLGLAPLERPRYQHTCTVLEDGSVLVAGGLDDTGARWTTLGDLFIYTPVPLD